MTNDQIFAIILTGISVVGALVGGWISPLISTRFEKMKIKASVQPNLVKIIYTFYNLRKSQYKEHLSIAFKDREADFCFESSNDEYLSEQERAEHKAKYKTKLSEIDRVYDSSHQTFLSLVQVESEMLSILSQVKTYYGKKKYEQLKDPINKAIDDSNDINADYDFAAMPRSEYNSMRKSLPLMVKQKDVIFNKECAKLIEIVDSVF